MAYLLLSPLTWGLLLALACWACWRWLGRALRIGAFALGFMLLLLCTPLGANALTHLTEMRDTAARCDTGPIVTGPIVLLSAGFAREPQAEDDYAALNPESWRRLRGAVELWKRDRTVQLVIVGGGPYAISESTMQARLAQEWGVPPSRLRVERGSTTTWEGAMALAGALPRKVRLVSSAMHLPRALIAYHAAGFKPCVVATDPAYVPPGGLGYLLPQSSALGKSELALHELVGRVWYTLRARPALTSRY